MSFKLNVFFIVFSALFFIGCLEGEEAGECSSQVVQDFQELSFACSTGGDFDCRSSVEEFNDNYPGISCQAEIENPFGGQMEPITINSDVVDQLQNGRVLFQ